MLELQARDHREVVNACVRGGRSVTTHRVRRIGRAARSPRNRTRIAKFAHRNRTRRFTCFEARTTFQLFRSARGKYAPSTVVRLCKSLSLREDAAPSRGREVIAAFHVQRRSAGRRACPCVLRRARRSRLAQTTIRHNAVLSRTSRRHVAEST